MNGTDNAMLFCTSHGAHKRSHNRKWDMTWDMTVALDAAFASSSSFSSSRMSSSTTSIASRSKEHANPLHFAYGVVT